MKRALPLFAVYILSIGILTAQSLKVVKVATTTDSNTGDKASIVHIKNISSAAISIKIQRTVNNLATDHVSSFCVGTNCYPPSTSVSPGSINIAAGGIDSSFHGNLAVNGNLTGCSTVAYEFYSTTNATDSVMVTFNYNCTTGIKDVSINESPIVQAPYPSPANTYSIIKYNIANGKQGTLNIYNALGALAYKTTLDEKQNEYVIPTLLLADGMYFCTLQVDGKPVATKKMIVDHRN